MRNAKDEEEAEAGTRGGVIAVTRALSADGSLRGGPASLSLAELSRRARMHKTTALRLARTLALSQYMVQTEDGQWRLGPAAGWLGARYQAGFDVNNVVEPRCTSWSRKPARARRSTCAKATSASCVARVEGPQSVRHNVRIGERLPLNRGAPGRVILAFSGAAGEPYESSASRASNLDWASASRGRQRGGAGVRLNWRLLGSMCISGPSCAADQGRS